MKKFIKSALCFILGVSMSLSFVACGSDHVCESPCPSCGECTDPECSEPECANKCDGDHSNKKEYVNNPETRPVIFSIGALDGNFNPFFATSGNDTEIAGITQLSMLTSDEEGMPLCGVSEPTVARAYTQIQYDKNGNATQNENATEYTEYSFLIKNNIKFSDGTDLTIKDVLFNLYVYLDPMYMGSATIYSTDIVGLKQYQTQDPNYNDDAGADFTSSSYATAYARINSAITYLTEPDEFSGDETQVKKDIDTAKALFREEVETDWTGIEGSLDSYTDEYSFEYDWQIYYLNEGIIEVKRELNSNGSYEKIKDSNGKYLTSLNDSDNMLTEEMESYVQANLSNTMNTLGLNQADATAYLQKQNAIQTVYENYTVTNAKFAEVLMYWETATTLREKIATEARSEELKKIIGNGNLKVKTIEGITTERVTEFDGETLSEAHDVLKIKINGVDPKAIWNFAFAVAPMHYYSNEEYTNKANGTDSFGVKFGDYDFFEDVLKDPDKNAVPVGAGVYMATDENGGTAKNGTFRKNKVVYFKRNEYWHNVLGQASTSYNAKIKYLNYKEIGDDKVIQSLISGEIDYGEPNATTKNISTLDGYQSFLGKKYYDAAGYGYVGINPKYVPDLEVRQAIMKAMNTSMIISNYYGSTLAKPIYRPMSSTSWAYNNSWTEYEAIAYTTTHSDIQKLVEKAGWKKNSNGIYAKNGQTLKLTFTIAGETTDHPAYAMFMDAAEFLEECGFDTITVKTDINALKSLATGGLEVWAAAWSSSLDPDMYQVYHKDSTATSVKNWGYPEILSDTTTYAREYDIVLELSEIIENARKTLNKTTRTAYYAEALDLVMDLAVELPTYQRKDMGVYNVNVIDVTSLNQNPSHYADIIYKLWELDYV